MKWFYSALVIGVFAGLLFWMRQPSRDEAAAQAETSKEKRYLLTGEVLSINAQEKTLRVRHDEIPGFMPAMTMDFDVNAGDLAIAKPGQHIKADLVGDENGGFRLEKIWPFDPMATAAVETAAQALNQDTVIRGRHAYREVGENLPSFALFDQEARVVNSERFRGKQVMLNFIFTRCPIATMCPAATSRFQQTQRIAREAGVGNLELVSITLDPEYDTPGVFKEYAVSRGIDTSNWSFLTGPEGAIKNLLRQFGVIAEFDGSLLKHTLTTLLIDENGRIIHRVDGSTWEPQEFVSKMRR